MAHAPKDLAAFLHEGLNAQQREAVEQEVGSLLVIAGAGSGKTRIITSRIAHLIVNKGVMPSSIVALTFTNKAAREMLERVQQFLGDTRDVPFIGTFHSYCVRMLKRNQHLLETPFISILDEDDQHKIINGIVQRHDLSKRVTVKQIAYQISQIKNRTVSPEEINETIRHDQLLTQIYCAYEAEKRASKCLDFDDLLLQTLALLKRNTSVLETFREQVKHILVDEYQDTNVVQHALLKHMTLRNKKLTADSICVVGDEDQSIYSWRGATVDNIVNFTKDFANTRIIKVEQNYRSVQPILTAANTVVANNTQRNPKELWSDRKGNDRLRVISCMTERQEGDLIAQGIDIARGSKKIETTAILYRAHFQSRALEEALIKRSLPYRIIGGIQFYERKEIKDIFAYLRLIANPFDRTAFFRVINCPARGLGDQFEELVRERWHQEPLLTYSDVIAKLIEDNVLTGVRRAAVERFIAMLAPYKPTDRATTTIEDLIVATGYLFHLQKTCDKDEAQERTENIKELIRAVQQFEQQGIATISALLDEVALMQERAARDNEDSNPVLLMTLHAAKGLEFDFVAISGLEDGILPSSRSLVTRDGLEEERRLCYVGITRAKEYLLLSHCRYRYTYGQTNDQLRSRFLDEIPAKLAPVQDCSHMNSYQMKIFFAEWLGTGSAPARTIQTFGTARQSISAKALATARTATVSAAKSAPKKIAPKAQSSIFKKHQTVRHEKFGIGIVQEVEQRDAATTFVQVRFKDGVKKIASSFLKTT